jgi:hypothetical protein
MMQDQGVRTFGGTVAEIVCRGATSGPGAKLTRKNSGRSGFKLPVPVTRTWKGNLNLKGILGYKAVATGHH